MIKLWELSLRSQSVIVYDWSILMSTGRRQWANVSASVRPCINSSFKHLLL